MTVHGPAFWLRWTLRDLRARWLQVGVIALVLAIGIGLFTGLGSMESWRTTSQDRSFALLRMHDLRMSLGEGSYVPEGRLRELVDAIPDASAVTGAEERLVAPTQVDASHDGRTVLAPGRIVGAGTPGAPLAVDALAVERGSGPARDAVLMEASFADEVGLGQAGEVRLAGGERAPYTGTARSPEYFIVTGPNGTGLGSASAFAVVFAPLRAAQALTGHPGMVNELALTLRPGTDVAAIERQLRAGLAESFPRVGAQITRRQDEDAHRLLYRDAANDQRLYNVFAVLVLAGAALGVFNLVSRVVESERRQIGIGMALGVPVGRLAIRPLALGAQIAVLGLVLGIPMGILAEALLRTALEELLPLPVLVTPFQTGVFLRGAIVGILLPFAAGLIPVVRALRVAPIEAIRVGFRSASGSGLAPLLRRVPVPGSSVAQMPVRNVLRAPRRTLMTLVGIAAIVTVVVAFAGMITSFVAPLERSERDALRGSPDRMNVQLATPLPLASPALAALMSTPGVSDAEPRIQVAGELRKDGRPVDSTIELLDAGSEIWSPRISEGAFEPGSAGIVLAEKAARDLGVGVGDTVTLRHPRRVGAQAAQIVDTPVKVVALHPNALRFLSYMDTSTAATFGLSGAANALTVVPASGVSRDEMTKAFFGRPGVASVQGASALTESLRKRIDDFLGVIRVTELAALLLALLIAFNSMSIAVDERTREHATMFAYGLPVATAIRLTVVEGAIVGAAGSLVGLAGGAAVIGWIIRELLSDTVPELAASVTFDGGVVAAAFLVGAGAMVLAPLLAARRLRRLDIPSALRVVE